MDTNAATIEVFERAAGARGRLLRIEADRPGAHPSGLLLTFDVGRIWVESSLGGLVAKPLDASPGTGATPGGLMTLDEEEPWWRFLGSPLTGVSEIEASGAESVVMQGSGRLSGVRLRFREASENPREVSVGVSGASLRVQLESESL